MARPRNTLPEACLERAPTKTGAKRRHQHDTQARHAGATRKIQAHNMCAGTMEIIYRQPSSPARRSAHRVRSRRAEDESKTSTKYTTNKKSTTTKSIASATSKSGIQLLSITAKPANKGLAAGANPKSFPLQVRNIVCITQPDGSERLAMISETTSFHDSQIAIVCVWLYTRGDICDDMVRHRCVATHDAAQKYLQAKWPMDNEAPSQCSRSSYMLSTERTIAIVSSDGDVVHDGTVWKVAPEDVQARLCREAVYDTCARGGGREICGVDEVGCQWLKNIL